MRVIFANGTWLDGLLVVVQLFVWDILFSVFVLL
jgi:hypothetical protein